GRATSSQPPLRALPTASGHAARGLPPCGVPLGAVPVPERAPGASAPAAGNPGIAAPVAPAELYVPALSVGGHPGAPPNADTAYIAAYLIRPPAPDVVVVTGKAPTFPSGNHPSPWPQPGKHMRYWSLCIGVGIAHLPTAANALPGRARPPTPRSGRPARPPPRRPHRLRLPRWRGDRAELRGRLRLRDRRRIAAGPHRQRSRRHVPAVRRQPVRQTVRPAAAQHARQPA